jgi:hypothetical protein
LRRAAGDVLLFGGRRELSHAREVLVADSRVTDLPDPSYREIARIDALTIPNLGEFDEFRTAHLFHWQDQPERSSSIASEAC